MSCSFCLKPSTPLLDAGDLAVCTPCIDRIIALFDDERATFWVLVPPPPPPPPKRRRSSAKKTATALEHVKDGIEKNVRFDDAETRFHLAVAYTEMGLHEDALREISIVLDQPEPKTWIEAFRMLLREPLLDQKGLRKIRSRLLPSHLN